MGRIEIIIVLCQTHEGFIVMMAIKDYTQNYLIVDFCCSSGILHVRFANLLDFKLLKDKTKGSIHPS